MNERVMNVAKWSRNVSMSIVLGIFLAACGDDDSSFAPRDEDSSSSVCEDCDDASSSSAKSSSSVTPHSSDSETSVSSSSSVKSSSSAKSSSSSAKSSSSVSSSSAKSSSSEYVPFDHSKTLAGDWRIGEDRYKTFTDPRNGRSYYYIKIIGKDRIGRKDSVTIMAENLNIGEMIDGYYDQKDDDKIERYCYNNDTTYCDEFGGLYQWAEMMQLPSRCNMESCSSLIEENHRGICPEGWRLMTYDDFYIAWHAETNEDGVKGLRSTYRFSGSNASGLSFVGAGWRTPDIKTFEKLLETAYWFYPKEVSDEPTKAFYSLLLRDLDYAPSNSDKYPKTYGYSVHCVMVEKQ